MAGKKKQTELSSIVMYICHTVRRLALVFLVLGALGLLLLSPGEVERGLYVFIIIANAVIFGGSYLLERFMHRSDREFAKKTEVRQSEGNKTISDWLNKKDAEGQK